MESLGACTSCVQTVPSHQRLPSPPAGSGYHPAGMGAESGDGVSPDIRLPSKIGSLGPGERSWHYENTGDPLPATT